MTATMRVSQVVGPRASSVVEVQRPSLGRDQVLVRVDASGVCASELPAWVAGPGSGPPLRLGHEAVGTVTDVGPDVLGLSIGDRVTGLLGEAFAEYVVADHGRWLRVPTELAPDAVLGEPLCCLVEARRRTRLALGDRVAIVGLGFMGLGMVQLVVLGGPSRLLAIDPRQDMLDGALELGADEVRTPDAVDAVDLATHDDPDAGFDVVIEATGTQAGLDLAGRLVRQHGVLSIVGYHQGGRRSVDLADWNYKAIDVVNAHVRRDADRMAAMATGLRLIDAGRIDLGRLVTHRYALRDVDDAFTGLVRKPPGFVKAVIHPLGS